MNWYLTHVDLYDEDFNIFAAADTVTNQIPSISVGWLLEQGYIEPADAPEEEEE